MNLNKLIEHLQEIQRLAGNIPVALEVGATYCGGDIGVEKTENGTLLIYDVKRH